MKTLIKKFFDNEILSYLFFGVATTIVSGFGNGLHSAYIVFALGMAVMSVIVWRITASYQRAK